MNNQQLNGVNFDNDEEDKSYNNFPAGRYEFKDSGIYIGEWLKEKAVGIGLLTKDKSQGEYTGLWTDGSEKCGVFLWPSAPGAMYEGDWAKSKRHGYGKFIKEDWLVMGKFQEGFITLGVKTKDKSIGKFEGEFEDGCPVFGMETYADGGTYSGEYKSGLREGYGVRTTVPYDDIYSTLPEDRKINLLSQLNSENNSEIYSAKDKQLPNRFKGGFVLSNRKSELLMKKLKHISNCKKHRKREEATKKGKKLKRSKSLTSVFSVLKKRDLYSTDYRRGRQYNMPSNSAADPSVKSAFVGGSFGGGLDVGGGNSSPKSLHSSLTFQTVTSIVINNKNTDVIGPDVIETYSGQWVQDQRSGFGVSERSDGVMYEGGWLSNQRHGFGITKFSDGSFEEGQYQNGTLIYLWIRRRNNPLFLLYTFRMGLHIRKAVKSARDAALKAQEKGFECRKKLTEIREVVQKANESAALAREYSLETRQLVKEMYPDFEQPGVKCLKDIVRMMQVSKRGQDAFDAMLKAALDVVEGRGIPQMLTKSIANETNDREKDNNILLIDSKGKKRTSRHGSFRRSKKVESQEVIEETVEPQKKVQIESAAKSTGKEKVKETMTSKRVMAAKAAPHNLQKTRIVVEDTSADVRLRRHNQKADENSVIDSTDNKSKDEEDDESFVAVDNIVATSQIPREPLLNILTSESVNDHFNYYDNKNSANSADVASSTSEIRTGGIGSLSNDKNNSRITRNSGSSNSNVGDSNTNSNRNMQKSNLSSQPMSPTRRYTVPEIMTEKPVLPKPIADSICECEEENEEESSDVIYVTENGVRKRVSPISNDEMDRHRNSKPLITSSQAILGPPQDRLSPLPMIFNFQSQANLRKDLKEGSLPDISEVRKRQEMSREEMHILSEQHRLAVALEKEKSKQGVFVIQLQRILDWIWNHAFSILIIVINLCILYAFYTFSKDYKSS